MKGANFEEDRDTGDGSWPDAHGVRRRGPRRGGHGDNGPDRLVGTAENDTIRGFGGNDVINAVDPGRPEDDRVNCGPGFDRVIVDPSTEDVVMGNCERVRVG